mmetsp:Transcript_20548/g.41442  ORF Transcript_20548/g.41442 Transcript_20548/m.41442 type:complete len:272 (-) Transcript_20548:134-949(-)
MQVQVPPHLLVRRLPHAVVNAGDEAQHVPHVLLAHPVALGLEVALVRTQRGAGGFDVGFRIALVLMAGEEVPEDGLVLRTGSGGPPHVGNELFLLEDSVATCVEVVEQHVHHLASVRLPPPVCALVDYAADLVLLTRACDARPHPCDLASHHVAKRIDVDVGVRFEHVVEEIREADALLLAASGCTRTLVFRSKHLAVLLVVKHAHLPVSPMPYPFIDGDAAVLVIVDGSEQELKDVSLGEALDVLPNLRCLHRGGIPHSGGFKWEFSGLS